MKYRSKTWVTAVLTASLLAIGVAQAQGPGLLKAGTVSKIEVAVWDSETKDEIARVPLGDELELAAGQSVILRLFAPRGHGPGDTRNYLPADLYVDGKTTHVELSKLDPAKGSYVLEAMTATNRPVVIGYELGKGIQVTKAWMAKSSLKVLVSGKAAAKPTPEAPDAAEAEVMKAKAMVNRLYEGILMREANHEKENVQGWVDEIAKEGYASVVEIAYDIAESEESQNKVAERGNIPAQRVLALYEHLLDLAADEKDRYQWRDHLRMMAGGLITEVVMDIVRSPEFRRVHGYN